MDIREIAYYFLLQNNIHNMKINLKILKDICRKNNWKLGCYSKNIKFIEISNLSNKMHLQAFTYYYKNEIFIFYNNNLEKNEIIFSILHEIGHILLKHKTCELNNLFQEKEANLFACEVLAPSCLIRHLKLTKIDCILDNFNLPPKYILSYINNFKNYNYSNSYLSKIIIKKFNNIKNNKFFFKKILIFILSTIIFLSMFIFTNNNFKNFYDVSIRNNQQIFYLTKTGKKYHIKNCRYLKNKDNYLILLNQQEINKYKPCSICILKPL